MNMRWPSTVEVRNSRSTSISAVSVPAALARKAAISRTSASATAIASASFVKSRTVSPDETRNSPSFGWLTPASYGPLRHGEGARPRCASAPIHRNWWPWVAELRGHGVLTELGPLALRLTQSIDSAAMVDNCAGVSDCQCSRNSCTVTTPPEAAENRSHVSGFTNAGIARASSST